MGIVLLDHKRFYGYRVCRKANGTVRVRYLSLVLPRRKGEPRGRRMSVKQRKVIYQEAQALDAQWATWQAKVHHQLRALAIPLKAYNNTGVRGIRFGKIICIKSRATVRRYEWDGFIVNCLDVTGHPHTYSCPVNGSGYQGAWEKACRKLAEYKRIPVNPLIERIPAWALGA